jgi:hypothetical protein
MLATESIIFKVGLDGVVFDYISDDETSLEPHMTAGRHILSLDLEVAG